MPEPLKNEQLFVFHPGESERKSPRWEFGLFPTGRCGATLTYPIPGFPWRRNPSESFEATVDAFTAFRVFEEVDAMQSAYPQECLKHDDLWSDLSEKANGVTRDKVTNKMCLTLMIYTAPGVHRCYFAMREDSAAWVSSITCRLLLGLLAPYLDLYPDGRTRRYSTTPMSVTDRADARSAPATGVADL